MSMRGYVWISSGLGSLCLWIAFGLWLASRFS